MTMISVVIPTHNRAAFLPEAIESALAQTHPEREVIVVDDASTDGTGAILTRFGTRIRALFQQNSERAAARNNGIRHARGEIIALLDSDDAWLPEHLESCWKLLRDNPRLGVAFAGSYLIDGQGRTLGRMPIRRQEGALFEKIVSSFSSGGCNASSCLIRRDILLKAGLFNENRALCGSEDWELWARLAALTQIAPTDRYTVKVRTHAQQTSANAERMSASMQLALRTVLDNPALAARTAGLRRQAECSMHTVIATGYYGCKDMRRARAHLGKALRAYPAGLFTNRLIIFTLLRSLLGGELSSALRKLKWKLQHQTLSR